MLKWVRGHLEAKHLDGKTARRLELVAEEALANVISHAYAKSAGDVEIDLTIAPELVTLVIRDWGPSYDPLLKAPKIDLMASLEDREAGGLGIHLILQIMDEVCYRREAAANTLTLFKKVSLSQKR